MEEGREAIKERPRGENRGSRGSLKKKVEELLNLLFIWTGNGVRVLTRSAAIFSQWKKWERKSPMKRVRASVIPGTSPPPSHLSKSHPAQEDGTRQRLLKHIFMWCLG